MEKTALCKLRCTNSRKVQIWQNKCKHQRWWPLRLCLATSWMVDNVEKVNALVQEDRWITVTDITNKLDIS